MREGEKSLTGGVWLLTFTHLALSVVKRN